METLPQKSATFSDWQQTEQRVDLTHDCSIGLSSGVFLLLSLSVGLAFVSYQIQSLSPGGRIPLLSVFLLIFTASGVSQGAEPVAVAGIIERATLTGAQFGTHFLRAERTGGIVASLRDHRALLPASLPARVILQATHTGRRDVNGLPLLDVDGVLPERWAQPASWEFFLKGPGAFSGFGRDAYRKDFAGIPFEELRAYERDNGIDGIVVRGVPTTVSDSPSPLRVFDVRLTRVGLMIRWSAVAGIKYQLHGSPTPEGPYRLVNEMTPAEDGDQAFEVTPGGANAFYRVIVLEP